MAKLKPCNVPFVDSSISLCEVTWFDDLGSVGVVESKTSGRRCRIIFKSIVGMRILGELDLAEFWLSQTGNALPESWLFEVESGGWFDLESKRQDFYLKHADLRPREYVIAGVKECLNVLTSDTPVIEELA